MAIDSQNGKHFPEEQILDWFTQICLALRYVHDSKILHRDLKCQNIFITKGNIIKLGDFGIACILSNTLENAKTMAGTPFNLSPEIIDGKEYSYKSDIWSLGIVLYEICALQPPFMANGFTLLAVKIMKGQFAPIPKHYSKDLQNLISMLLRIDPLQRPSIAEILNLPFIKQRIIEPWGITKNMCLSPHQLVRMKHLNIL
jgi:NIMA (never in mitosis gene a)-related kinase